LIEGPSAGVVEADLLAVVQVAGRRLVPAADQGWTAAVANVAGVAGSFQALAAASRQGSGASWAALDLSSWRPPWTRASPSARVVADYWKALLGPDHTWSCLVSATTTTRAQGPLASEGGVSYWGAGLARGCRAHHGQGTFQVRAEIGAAPAAAQLEGQVAGD